MSHFNSSHSGLFEHCVCPDGFFGIQCEHKLEICPGGDHVCLHGSQCMAENEGGDEGAEDTTYKCDCDDAFDAVERYAGKFCQYSSTDICTHSGQPGVGKANFAFCVNNGKCKAKVNDNEAHPGCLCSAEFSGDHCEFLKTSESSQEESSSGEEPSASSTSSSDSGSDGAVVGVSVTLMIVIVVAGFFVLRALFCGGRARGGKSGGADVEAAVAEEEAASKGFSDVRRANGQQQLKTNGTGGTAVFEEGGESLDDLEDFTNDSNASSLTEDGGMTNVQIV
jgi:hypothetical protein